MSIPFAQTLHALEADRRGGRAWALLAGLVLLGLWIAWAALAEVPVLAESAAAGIETAQPLVALDVPADGRVAAAPRLALGQEIRAGQALLVLESGDLRDRLTALQASRAALVAQASSCAAEEAAARRALDESDRGRSAAEGEAAAMARQAAAAAALAEQARARGERLAAVGLLSDAEAARGRAEADQRREGAEAAAMALAVRSHEGRAGHADRRGNLGRLAGERSRLRGEIAVVDGDAAGLAREIAHRTLRAPSAGWLASLLPLAAGSHVAGGARLATLIAAGTPWRLRAIFPALAGMALRPGQRAWVHFAAGFGAPAAALPATVIAVARFTGGATFLALPPFAAAAPFPAAGFPIAPIASIAPIAPIAPIGGAGHSLQNAAERLPPADGGVSFAASSAAGAPTPAAPGEWDATLALALPADLAARTLSLRAGEPCRVEVEVARRTPAALLLQALRQGGAP